MKKKDLIELFIGSVLIALFSYLIFQQRVKRNLDYFWRADYHYLIYGALISAFIFILFKRFNIINKLSRYLKYPAFILFLPFALFPVIRCYFKVPYVFCRVCPKPCAFGLMRPFIIPAFLIQNLDCRFWCFKLCPFGAIQDSQGKVCKKKICLPSWLRWIRYVILAFVSAIVILLIFNLGNIKNGFFFTGTYHWIYGTLIAALAIFILAFFIPRFFCNYFCPIGAVGDICLKVESKIRKNNKCNMPKKCEKQNL